MSALAIATGLESIPNIIAMPTPTKREPVKSKLQRFKVTEFENRTGSKSWRVSGSKRDGTRIRENFMEAAGAQARQIELETEYLRGHAETTIRATKLSAEQVQLAEVAFIKLGDDWARLLDAVDHWNRTGAKNINTEAPRIDDAVEQYLEWLAASPFRDTTKRHWKTRMNVFKNSVRNMRVSEVTPETIDLFLAGRNVSACGKDTDRRAVSRFFSWCIERPRRWATSNPCREVKVHQAEKGAPPILSLAECKALLQAAENHRGGKLAPYVAVCLFGGLRPFEASRLNWSAVNLKDRELRLEGNQTKTGRGRVVVICNTLAKWLKRYEGIEFFPANWRKEFAAIKLEAGFGTPDPKNEKRKNLKPWPDDVLRHTGISHYFRKHESYGKAAEQFGNSEAIIKAHYQARVSTTDTKKFYGLMPRGAK